ncbi:OLC1v1002513C1 [Oldenlandia corymbosa var. corymbosa]|uniref:OLC1v1002513C1 n=1 Tax=Oldenlandia corymbosa var. corymbosa TaxID=529605 RepID=A0AAV1DAM8_OLDCO|nr:OLC1v1002513C1 [Oldenlandia corymbosa var. corymbosa]
MERSEPSLVPEWLKTSGTATGNGTTTHPQSSSSTHPSDDHAVSKIRTKSWNHNGHELGRSPGSDRNSSSSYFRRSSNSNGSSHLRSYGSFGRNSRSSRDWDRDAYDCHDGEKSFAGDHKQRDFLDPPFSIERDGLRRSQSMVSAKRGEAWPKRSINDSNTATRMKSSDGNGLLDKGNSVGSLHKAAFEREFPSLGSDEKPSAAEIGRIPSPVLSTAIHGMPLNSSAMIGADKWTSALAEAPSIIGGSNVGLSTGQQVLPSSSVPLPSSASTGLNMAETIAQGPPSRAPAAPKTSTGIQRLEELAIRQSRQLIPMTPSTPKPLVLNSADKGKGKAGQQQHSTPLPTPLRGVPAKNDVGKPNNAGKLLVLKPIRERVAGSSASKDNLGSKETTSSLTVAASVTGSATTKGSATNVVSPSAERKHILPMLEKRSTSQSQSRHDFFNLVRKKSLPNSSAVPETGTAAVCSPADGPGESASTADEPGETEVSHGPTHERRDVPLVDVSNVHQPLENRIDLKRNSTEAFHKDGNLQNGRKHSTSLPLFSEEEEAAFLHKLGWQENADEGEGALTEEEINAFFRDLSKVSVKYFYLV